MSTASNDGFTEVTNEVSRKCNDVIEKYRSGAIEKVDAILQLQATIPKSAESDAQFKSAFTSYIAILDGADRARDAAAKRGQAAGSGDNGDEEGGQNEPPRTDGDETASKRSRSYSGSEGEDDEHDGRPSKRSIDESRLPWVVDELLHPVELSRSLQLTREYLELWSTNSKRYKASLVNAARCPEFPDSEWSNIVEGKPVNLDVVFTGHYSTSFDSRRTEKIGELQLTFGESKPSKHVESAGDWLVAWTKASEALRFAFPHREQELREYGSYITQLFGAVHPSRHHRVDVGRFADLHLLHIDSSGAVAIDEERSQTRQGRSGESRRRGGRITEACRRWNENRCPVDAARCRYVHACSNCRSREHTADLCTAGRARNN
ncbi:hypothetical protein NEOLEDRAFT_1143417 [Neolentinus lepideus HHB14362 ss-1]|uniref:C3H1-type domain-containing protein n=1 Tax=Neolentinus lepideus HHB14362 ss-1 TaxID=1314782 RepID=A0A165MKC4_9AGAM|nr:hypothetical protein NEOLEDRAFT_1143417 [Neolentinus lepideus HHB14362 ss-1]